MHESDDPDDVLTLRVLLGLLIVVILGLVVILVTQGA